MYYSQQERPMVCDLTNLPISFQKNKNKSNKKSHKKVNVKHAPYHLKDGDVIGIKVSISL